MRTILAVGVFLIVTSCDQKQKSQENSSQGKDTIVNQTNSSLNTDTIIKSIATSQENLKQEISGYFNNVAEHRTFDELIIWDDFKSDSLQFDRIPHNPKPVRVRYNTAKLIGYLAYLKDHGYDSTDVFFGKYIDADEQPSHTPIPRTHRRKYTIMFSGKGMSKETTPSLLPYNVGSPWP